METIKILSWNVNGIRAVHKKGALDWFLEMKPHILCLQETKANVEQIPAPFNAPEGYHAFFSSAERKGYSGVALYSSIRPEQVETGLGIPRFDNEGRILIAKYQTFTLFNIYFPNGKASAERLAY